MKQIVEVEGVLVVPLCLSERREWTLTGHRRPKFAVMHNTVPMNGGRGVTLSLREYMRRREFITLVGSAAAAWPLTARAQQLGKVPLVGVLMPFAAGDEEAEQRRNALQKGLEAYGWTNGQNIRIEFRWVGSDRDRIRNVTSSYLVRRAPIKGGRTVAFDDVMDALRALDACATETSNRYRRVVRKRRIFSRGSDESGHSQPLQ